MYSILHIFPDDKFFDDVSSFFDSIPEINNIYIYYTPKVDYCFEYIKNTNKVRVVTDLKEYYKILGRKDIDIVYFHSLPQHWYSYLFKIHPKTKVVWWVWGYDIYYSWRHCEALVKLDLLKPLTKDIIQKSQKPTLIDWCRKGYYHLTAILDKRKQKLAISRIDYCSPVIKIEYELLKKRHPHFKAQPFMLNSGPGFYTLPEFHHHINPGNIIIGNSLTATNNHVDIFQAILNCKLNQGQKYIVPISYGSDIDKNDIKTHLNLPTVLWLETFIPKAEYKNILNSVTHAIFGVIRQQAMGNIYYCLSNGIKIYLYSDSLVYQHLISEGYIVYRIEDIEDDSFLLPLDAESAHINYSKLTKNHKENVSYAYNEILRILSCN